MQRFHEICEWFGENRIVAFILGWVCWGITWAMAGIGRSLSARKGGENLIQIWGSSSLASVIRVLAGVTIATSALAFILCFISGDVTVMICSLFFAASLVGSIEFFAALGSGRDSFALATAFEGTEPTQCEGPIQSTLQRLIRDWPPVLRTVVGLLWALIMANTMLAVIGVGVMLAFMIAILALILHLCGNDNTFRATIKEGHGGVFSETFATIEGNQIKKGTGGALAEVLATIEGNQIKKGTGGAFAEVLATIEGNQIKKGTGGMFASVIGTIEGNQIKGGYGGWLSDTLYTVEK